MTDRPVLLRVFAVEDTSAQLTWSSLGRRRTGIEVDGRVSWIDHPERVGALEITGLGPDTHYDVHLHRGGHRGSAPVTSFRTQPPGPGLELSRFATLSDLHLGTTHFGALRTMRERRPEQHHPFRSAEAAISEALQWGAEMLVVKGDITEKGHPREWDLAGELLGDLPVPVRVLPGNHDTVRGAKISPADGAARAGLTLTTGLDTIDLEGLRLLLVNTCKPRSNTGEFQVPIDQVADAAGAAPGAVMVAMHHHLQRHAVPTHWPPGISGPAANRLLRALAEANPAVLATSGHTHRNRRRDQHGIAITEVSATKDYPGVWAGYVVYERGIRQVVRRIVRPDVITWTDYCRKAVGGLWGRWSPGNLAERSFVHEWAAANHPQPHATV